MPPSDQEKGGGLCSLLAPAVSLGEMSRAARRAPRRGLAEQGLLIPRLHTEPKPCPAALTAPTAGTAQTPVSEDLFAPSSCLCEFTVLDISFIDHLPSESQTLPWLPGGAQFWAALDVCECPELPHSQPHHAGRGDKGKAQ